MTIAERVAAGAAWLDEHAPGWIGRIDVDHIRMSDCTRCILGQVYGSYWESPLIAEADPLDDGDDVAVPLGFQVADDEPWEGYDLLAKEWRRLILDRRGAVPDA